MGEPAAQQPAIFASAGQRLQPLPAPLVVVALFVISLNVSRTVHLMRAVIVKLGLGFRYP